MLRLLIAIATLVLVLEVKASSNYYPTNYKEEFKNDSYSGEELKQKLFILLTSVHMYKSNRDDIIAPHCSGKGKCYQHKDIGYRGARKVLFGKIHLKQDEKGYFIKDVYCRKRVTRGMTKLGPNVIPKNSVLNCEHTWPQSRFNRSFNKSTQKSDLHHLYPTDPRANSTRGNNEFAEVDGDALIDCDGSYIGVQKWHGSALFEPPTEHKGNVARALFYFSVRYKLPISAQEEDYLRRWHELDPVDSDEVSRNNMIHKVQGNRNPFIDYPKLVSRINNF